MLKTVEGILQPGGTVQLLEAFDVTESTRVLITVMTPKHTQTPEALAVASEAALKDWLEPDEDAAWNSYQEGK